MLSIVQIQDSMFKGGKKQKSHISFFSELGFTNKVQQLSINRRDIGGSEDRESINENEMLHSEYAPHLPVL